MTDMDNVFCRFLAKRRRGHEHTEFSITQLSDLVRWAGEAVWSMSEDHLYSRLNMDSTAKWELGIQYLEFYTRACSYSPKPIITEFYDMYESIFSSPGHTNLPVFRESFLVRAAEVTALERFVRPDFEFDSWHSIHGIISERNQHHERIYSFQRCRDYRLMHARNQASISRKHPTAAGNFHQDLLNTDCWFEILKLLNTKDRANMKSTSTYIYNCINASTLYCDLTYSCLNASTLYSELTEATMFTRILDRSGNTSNFQQVPVTPETMEGQPFWYLEIRGARNKNNKNMSLSPGIVLIKTMASLSHPRRLTGISIDSVADVALMVLVWKAYLHELRNLRYLTIVACSESLPVEIFKTHKALNGLEYEVDVIDEAVVMDEGKRRMLWIYQSSLPILQPTRPLGARI